MRAVCLVSSLLLAIGCGETTAAERGEALFSDPGLSPAASNAIACTHCHVTGALTPSFRPSGGTLEGALGRASYFGGAYVDPREAINACLRFFMRHPSIEPLSREDARGRDLLSYLETLGTDPAPAVPFTIPRDILDTLPPGDDARGEAMYDAACRNCHGAKDTGAGRASPLVAVIPLDTVREHGETGARAYTIEKVRHGQFFGIGGDMAPFSLESLSDQELADILSHMGL